MRLTVNSGRDRPIPLRCPQTVGERGRHVLPSTSSHSCLGFQPACTRPSAGEVDRNRSSTMTQHETFIGIDVSKAQLDGAGRPSGERQQVPNTEAASAAWLSRGGGRRPPRSWWKPPDGWKCRWSAPWPPPGCRLVWSIHVRCATLPKPRGAGRRPMRWTPPCWRSVPKRYGRRRGRSPMTRRRTCGRC